jgi:hypothetical protein
MAKPVHAWTIQFYLLDIGIVIYHRFTRYYSPSMDSMRHIGGTTASIFILFIINDLYPK